MERGGPSHVRVHDENSSKFRSLRVMLSNADDEIPFARLISDIPHCRRPTPVAIYNINWPEMRQPGQSWLQYLNLNQTDNSTLEFNYRQQESAFWSEYMPSVVGYLLPTYRPFTEVRTFRLSREKRNTFIRFVTIANTLL